MVKKLNRIDIEKSISKDPMLRKALARDSFFWFFHIYLSDYISYKTAEFQKDMILIAEDTSIETAVIVAFRGSGKSTIMSLAYPIWAMIGAQEKKHIILLSQTQNLCGVMLNNIKDELEKNTQLIRDFGPFKRQSDQWSSNALIINKYNCRIAAVSCEESIRGIRYKEYRPDLIICDDVEDLSSVKTKEGRDKTFNWLTRDIIPAGDVNTKTIVIGNKLHEDGLMMRLKRTIEESTFKATYKEYPLLNGEGKCLWPQKFVTEKDISALKSKVATESAWQREFLLMVVQEEDAVIKSEWVKYYDDFPLDMSPRYIVTGIDLAISKEDWADYTAMVSAMVYGYREHLKIYILPHPVNERLDFPETVEKAKKLSTTLGNGSPTKLFIEEVAYQSAVPQELINQGYPAEGVKPHGQDKRARLTLTAPLIKNGNILFPKKGCEDLIRQLTCFGCERHEDLADAFSMLVLKISQDSKGPSGMTIWEWPSGGVEI